MNTALAAVIVSLVACDVPAADVQLDRELPTLKVGEPFRDEMKTPLTASWSNVPVRRVLRRLAELRGVSILLDRRIDPTQEVTAEFSGQLLQGALETIAGKANAKVCVVENTIFIGPPHCTAKLRTLAAVRFQELQDRAAQLPRGRLAELGERRLLHWNDLDRPADLLNEIAARYRLKIEAVDRVPHDLWGGASLPSLNAVESLTLVLAQFDLTFEWSENAAGVRLVAIPDRVTVDRDYAPRGLTPIAAAKDWAARIDGLEAKRNGRRVLVTGTIEQHEAVTELLRPTLIRPPRKPPTSQEPVAKRSYAKLKIEREPAIALIRYMEKTGIVFKYDEQQLKDAGIDLNQPISLDLKNVTAEELFAEFCKPLELKFSMEGVTVTLSPK